MASLSAAAAEGSDEEDLELLEDLPLPELFGEVQRIYNRVASDALSGKDQDNAVQRGLVLIPKVAQLVRSSGVFSPNEEVEDVNTGDLRYLFVDYFRGKLVPKSPQAAGVGNPGARLQALKQARVSFLAFLHRCEAIKLIPPGPELDFLHSLDSPESALTANMSRSNKIDRFKNEKDAAARLEAVEAMLRASPDASANEDQLRERILLSLQSAVRQALEDIESIDREKGILEFMVARMGGGASSDRHGPPQSAAEDPRVQQRQSAMDAAMDPTRPGIQVTHINRNGQGSLAVSKEQIKTSVFRPGHRLPTMSIEELADKEVREAMEREQRQKNAPKPDRKYKQLEADGEEDDERLADIATYKDRAWDDWKDENPRGAGNKAGKRF